LIVLVLLFGMWLPTFANGATAEVGQVHLIVIDGEITPAMASFLVNAIREANETGAAGILIRVKTLGGRVDAALKMRDAMVEAATPVAVYVESRAISAGALITVAARHIVMASGSHIGAAKPIPDDPKSVAFVSGEFRTTAERYGRDPKIAMAMVDEALEIEGLVRAGEILDMTVTEALRLGYADYLAESVEEALGVLGWGDAAVHDVEMGERYRIAQFLTSYEVASLLLTIGMIALIAEFNAPGFGAPGLIALLCFALYFSGGFIAGNTNLWPALIFMAGIVLLLIEFVVPGFGVFGISGLGAMLVGIVLAAPSVRQGVTSLVIALVVAVLSIPLIIRIFGKTKAFRKLVLSTAETVENGYVHAPATLDLTGQRGTALTLLRPAGMALIGGVRTDVYTQGDFIALGTDIEVIRMEGNKVVVARVPG
jgi:membrane-bound serine protease (ClpP class)